MKRLAFTAFCFGIALLPVSNVAVYAQTKGKQAAPSQQQTIVAASKVPELSEEQMDQWIGKLNTYTKLYNSTSRALDSWRRYKSWVNVKTGPTGKERTVYGLYSISDDIAKEEAPKTIEASKAEPKMNALDSAAASFSDAMIKLDPILREAYSYYNRKDYSDDKFAKGKEIHPGLVEAFETVERTRAVFDVELTSVKEQVDQQYLTQIEKKDGKTYRWHSKRVMMASLKAIEALQAVKSKGDLPSLSEAIKAYAAIVHEYDDYIETADDLPRIFSMKDKPDSLLSNLREARDTLEKGNANSFNSYARSAVSNYNDMVRFGRM